MNGRKQSPKRGRFTRPSEYVAAMKQSVVRCRVTRRSAIHKNTDRVFAGTPEGFRIDSWNRKQRKGRTRRNVVATRIQKRESSGGCGMRERE
jgi:hypothetical protein